MLLHNKFLAANEDNLLSHTRLGYLLFYILYISHVYIIEYNEREKILEKGMRSCAVQYQSRHFTDDALKLQPPMISFFISFPLSLSRMDGLLHRFFSCVTAYTTFRLPLQIASYEIFFFSFVKVYSVLFFFFFFFFFFVELLSFSTILL